MEALDELAELIEAAGGRTLALFSSWRGVERAADFLRVRVGIGKPPGRGVDWVLGRPSKADRVELDVAVQRAADAVEKILADGVDAAMQVYNRDDL